MENEQIRIYSNDKVNRIIAFIPRGHLHARFVIELCDQIIVLHESVVAALTRAYIDIVTHPEKRAKEMKIICPEKPSWKQFYAKCQLIETDQSEEEVLKISERILALGFQPCK
ncbi:MAG: hypothetical protein QXE81_02625 [Desulfurococcaceae archaeon]